MKIKASEERLRAEMKSAIKASEERLRAEMRSAIKASEERLRAEMRSAIKESEERLRAEIKWQVGEAVDILRAEMQAGFRGITGTIDAFLGKLETYGRESQTLPATLDQHGQKLREHEIRLTALEASK